jgi:hypothetical protein
MNMLRDWIYNKLTELKDQDRIIICDPLHIIPDADSLLNTFAQDYSFTVIIASTNLVFRELYEKALADSDVRKILLLDRAPARRRVTPSITKAPPPFYPDLLAETPEKARINLDLKEFLVQQTGDALWKTEANDPRYARLIVRNLKGVLRAHQNLQRARPGQFTDSDFKTIVAYASLGVAEAAFKKLDSKSLWRIALLSHKALAELELLAPETTRPIKQNLKKAPPPFCWFAEHSPETAIKAFYLALILSQHLPNWNLLLVNLDHELAAFTSIDQKILTGAAPGLIQLNPKQADQDLTLVEESITKDALDLILFKQLNISEPDTFTKVLEQEKFSILIRSLALLMATDNLLAPKPAFANHKKISTRLFADKTISTTTPFVEQRQSENWSHLKEAYRLSFEIQKLRVELAGLIKLLSVKKSSELDYAFFWEQWNAKRLNRLEYYLSALERILTKSELLPRPASELPTACKDIPSKIRARIQTILAEVNQQLDQVNSRFQEMVVTRYPGWLLDKDDVYLASHFIRRVLKPRWDPASEKAVVFIFDGMRYEVWDEFLRPMLLDRMEVVDDLPAAALLPSETEISRWAISAGTEPAYFWPRKSEDKHLKDALLKHFNFQNTIDVLSPDGAGTGETVRYKGGNLEVYIFEFCDKELHRIGVKTLPDGREVPTRPLAFVYEQYIKNIIENEIMSIVRTFSPGTKLFITADHGFTRVHRERIWLESAWLNDPTDCTYLHAKLKSSLKDTTAPAKVRQNVWEFPVDTLRMPRSEDARDRATKTTIQKNYATIIFPKTGFALSRPGASFQPAAYTHGGISIQELMIPMIMLKAKTQEESLLSMGQIVGPADVVEGQDAEFIIPLERTSKAQDELRVELHASLRNDKTVDDTDDQPQQSYAIDLMSQVLYLTTDLVTTTFRVKPQNIQPNDQERRAGTLQRTITITASYTDGHKTHRKSRTYSFSVRLNSQQIIRRVGNLGNILGLAPKTLR